MFEREFHLQRRGQPGWLGFTNGFGCSLGEEYGLEAATNVVRVRFRLDSRLLSRRLCLLRSLLPDRCLLMVKAGIALDDDPMSGSHGEGGGGIDGLSRVGSRSSNR
mmetsp:Transcript_19809/g.46375  ORF Transcript_19809/g.46375 Transcript_19809/m.46375 type:complete len:106 (+) Transcript_19809:507-824(+)